MKESHCNSLEGNTVSKQKSNKIAESKWPLCRNKKKLPGPHSYNPERRFQMLLETMKEKDGSTRKIIIYNKMV